MAHASPIAAAIRRYRTWMCDKTTPIIIASRAVEEPTTNTGPHTVAGVDDEALLPRTTFPDRKAFNDHHNYADMCDHYATAIIPLINGGTTGPISIGGRLVYPTAAFRLTRRTEWHPDTQQTITLMCTTRWQSKGFTAAAGVLPVTEFVSKNAAVMPPKSYVTASPAPFATAEAVHIVIGFTGVDADGNDVSGAFDPTAAQIDCGAWKKAASSTGPVVVFDGMLSYAEIAKRLSEGRGLGGPYKWAVGNLYNARHGGGPDGPIHSVFAADCRTVVHIHRPLPEPQRITAAIALNTTVTNDFYSKCRTCNRPATMRCARCKCVRYCCAACQSVDWKLRHKAECVHV